MRRILLFFCLAFCCALSAQEITVIQINAYWNDSNTRRDLRRLKDCQYTLAYLEDQPKDIREQILSVPTVLIYEDKRLVKAYQAGIDLTLKPTLEDIQQYIYLLKNS